MHPLSFFKKFSITLILLSSSNTMYAHTKPEDTLDSNEHRPPIAFVPIKESDITNPTTGQPYKKGEMVEVLEDGVVKFKGTIDELVVKMNDAEKYFNSKGLTLKNQWDLNLKNIKFEDLDKVNSQYLVAAKIIPTELQVKVDYPYRTCPIIELINLGINPSTQKKYQVDDKIKLNEGSGLKAHEFVARINEQQRYLCSLGYAIFESPEAATESGGSNAVTWLMEQRNIKLSELGISKFNPIFSMTSITPVKEYADIAADIEKAIQSGELPSPERLEEIRRKVNAEVLPEEFKIPEMPNIPSVDIPKRSDLKLEKGKNWKFFEGNQKIAAAYADAFYELRGNEKNQDLRAQGKAGLWVLGREINAIYGSAAFSAGEAAKCTSSQTPRSGICGYVDLKVFGNNIFPPINHFESVKYTINEPEKWKYEKQFDYQANFYVGPIPVTVNAGVKVGLGMGYEAGLSLTKANGKVFAKANTNMHVSGGLGNSSLSVGAGGDITILKGGPELYGSSEINFDSAGVPFLELQLNSNFNYHYLGGEIFAYAEYPWLKCSWRSGCKYVKKRETNNLWSWEGRNGNIKIMNWGSKINPFGATLRGDLVDQSDQKEIADLSERLNLEQRKIAIAKMEQESANKTQKVMEGIMKDLISSQNTAIEKDAISITTQQQKLEELRNKHYQDLRALAENHRD